MRTNSLENSHAQKFGRAEKKIQVVVTSTVPEEKQQTIHLSARSRRSIFALLSLLCCASIGSVASLFSVASIGSVASVASIGSTASVVSLASVGSSISVASVNCFMGMFQDCTPIEEANRTFSIDISNDVWRKMASCSKREYQSDPRPEKCEYQPANCSYGTETSYIACEVRRKGSTSWRNMNDKPSFKVKFEEEVAE